MTDTPNFENMDTVAITAALQEHMDNMVMDADDREEVNAILAELHSLSVEYEETFADMKSNITEEQFLDKWVQDDEEFLKEL